MGDLLQDPFQVSIHIITDPGEAKTLQSAADQLLSLLHPQLALFRVSERAERHKLRPHYLTSLRLSLRPCLSVILFLQENYGGEESHEQQLRRPPWHYHHTEQVKGLSFSPAVQDFFTLAPGTPLWALRQVHYGKQIVRFTLYCRYETYSDQVRLYSLLLRRPVSLRNRLYSCCVVYSNQHMEIQLSFKRSPRGQDPSPTECTLMEIRVRNMGGLIPLLPHSCRPISAIRWQTKDYDGNKILLQGSSEQSRDTIPSAPSSQTPSFPPSHGCVPSASQKCHRSCRSTSRCHTQNPPMQPSQSPLPLQCKQEDIKGVQCSQEIVCAGWTDLQTRSLISMATEAFHSVSTYPSTSHPSSFSLTMPRFRINVDTLVGAKETDVDTGQAVISRSIDLSVVSAYLLPQTQMKSKAVVPQPLPEPQQFFSSTSSLKLSNKTESLPKSVCDPQANLKGSRGKHQSNGSEISQDCTQEDKQEFFI